MLNKNFEILLALIDKHSDKLSNEDKVNLIVGSIKKNSSDNSEETLKIRETKEYKEYIDILMKNLEHMISKSDLLYIFNVNGDKELEDIFKNITDKQEFVKDFVVFNK